MSVYLISSLVKFSKEICLKFVMIDSNWKKHTNLLYFAEIISILNKTLNSKRIRSEYLLSCIVLGLSDI